MKSTEEIIVNKVEGIIRGIKFKTKKVEDTNVYYLINKLKNYNHSLADELYNNLCDTLDKHRVKELTY